MGRLTNKEKLNSSDLYKMEIDCELEMVAQWHNKLHDLEDIEEELGSKIVDLSKCLLACKNGFYSKESYTNIKTKKIEYYISFHDYAYCYFREDTNDWWIATISESFPVYGYGKTWALTREELEQ